MAAVKLYLSPPPSVGWWPAASMRVEEDRDREFRIIRYWDGERWSVNVDPAFDSPDKFDFYATLPGSVPTSDIFWRYPSDPGDELPEFPPA